MVPGRGPADGRGRGGADGRGSRRMRPATSWAAPDQARAMTAISAAHQGAFPDEPGAVMAGAGMIRMAASGTLASAPARVASGPNRRTQIEAVTARTNSVSPRSGCSNIWVLISLAPAATRGRTRRPGKPGGLDPGRCRIRPTDSPMATARSRCPPSSRARWPTSSALPKLASAAAMVTAAARSRVSPGSRPAIQRRPGRALPIIRDLVPGCAAVTAAGVAACHRRSGRRCRTYGRGGLAAPRAAP